MGVGYGLTLAALSLLLMGFGHGTYLPLAISSAPLAVIKYPPPFTFFIGLGGCVVLWVFVAAISCSERRRPAFRTVLILHYIGVAIAVIEPIDGDWSYFSKMLQVSGPAVLLWIVAYVLGQAMVWNWFAEGKSTAEAAQHAAGAGR